MTDRLVRHARNGHRRRDDFGITTLRQTIVKGPYKGL